MTCIAALLENGNVYMGGDSAGVAGTSLSVRSDPKVFKVGKFLFGFTSSFRMGQLLRFGWTPPDHDPRTDDYEYMVTKFVDSVRERFKNGGFNRNTSGVDSGGVFLVGYKGKLYRIDADYQVGTTVDPWDAVGCGGDVALGSLFTSPGRPPEERVKVALEAAERHSSGVRGPFLVISMGG